MLAVTIAVNYGLGERQSRLQESKLRSMYKVLTFNFDALGVLFSRSLIISNVSEHGSNSLLDVI